MFNHRNSYFFGNAANLWHIFIFAGVFSLTAPYFISLEVSQARTIIVGVVALIIGIVLKINYYGIQIDFDQKKYRNFISILGFKQGNWIVLPELERIVLTSKNVSTWNTPNGISPTHKSNATIFTIALFRNSEQLELFFQTENESDAINKAKQLAEKLHIPLEQ